MHRDACVWGPSSSLISGKYLLVSDRRYLTGGI